MIDNLSSSATHYNPQHWQPVIFCHSLQPTALATAAAHIELLQMPIRHTSKYHLHTFLHTHQINKMYQ
jgi:hypothetical protein